MIPQWVIEKKRDGGALDEAELRAFIKGFTAGAIPDYQMSAWLMAWFPCHRSKRRRHSHSARRRLA